MASLYAKGGYIYISIYLPNGEREQKSTKIKDNREGWIKARKLQKEKEIELAKPIPVVIADLTLAEVEKRFKRHNFDKAKSTVLGYEVITNYLKQFFGDKKKVRSITKEDIIDFKDFLKGINSNITSGKLSQNTIASYFRSLKSFFNFLIDNGFYVDKNPVPRLKTEERPIETIPNDHFKLILAYLKGRSKDQYRIIRMLQLTGKRVNEILSLKWEDVYFEEKLIKLHNKKAKKQELIPMHKKLREFLEPWSKVKGRQKKGKIFPYKSHHSLGFWKRTLANLKLPQYKLHSIRKTFVTRLVHKSVPIFDASKITGQSISTMIQFYAKVDVNILNKQLDDAFKED